MSHLASRIIVAAMGPLLLVAALGMFAGARAQAAPSLAIVAGPSTATISVANLDPSDGFNGFDVTLGFDTTAAEAVSVSASGAWDTSLVPPAIDNAAGTIRVVGISLAPSCGTGCPLFTVTFSARSASSTVELSVLDADLSTSNGRPIETGGGPLPVATIPAAAGTGTATPGSGATPTTPTVPAESPGASSTPPATTPPPTTPVRASPDPAVPSPPSPPPSVVPGGTGAAPSAVSSNPTPGAPATGGGQASTTPQRTAGLASLAALLLFAAGSGVAVRRHQQCPAGNSTDTDERQA